jgi:hypothetical protein
VPPLNVRKTKPGPRDEMKTPIILRADDGVSWWPVPHQLELSIESPDIEAGLYSAWDAQGQILEVVPVEPVRRGRFFGIETVSVSPGRLVETGTYRPDELTIVIQEHLADVLPSPPFSGLDLATALNLLCQSQPSRDS